MFNINFIEKKKIAIAASGILFCLGLSLAGNQKVYGQDGPERICCIESPMRHCILVIYSGPDGLGSCEHFPFGGIRVACPRIP